MKHILFISAFILQLIFFSNVTLAQEVVSNDKEQLVKARIIDILEEGERNFDAYGENYSNAYQKVRVRLLDGAQKGDEIIIDHGGNISITPSQRVKKGDVVVMVVVQEPEGSFYQIIDKYRLNEIIYVVLLFFALVVLLSRWKGVGSILGMIVSLGVIVKFIVPRILSGEDPLLVSIGGSMIILLTTIYLAHGFSRQTSVAVVSTLVTLIITGLLAFSFVGLTGLSGLANEDALSLQFGQTANINFRGLLLGGMIIGFLGVLDDVTTGMAAIVFELKKVNPKLKTRELISSSLNVGKEHVSSLVNTLVLAYAGASLPLFLFIVLNPGDYPLWFIINSEFIAEEIVRTLVGSMGLLGAVPITAIIAASAVGKYGVKISQQ